MLIHTLVSYFFCGLDFSLDLPAYLKELRELKEMYRGQIRLKIGVELGLQNRIRPYLESFMKEYGEAFDFIIGSSHFVDRVDPYDGAYWQDKTFEQAMGRAEKVATDHRLTFFHVRDIVSYGMVYSLQMIKSVVAGAMSGGDNGLESIRVLAHVVAHHEESGADIITVKRL